MALIATVLILLQISLVALVLVQERTWGGPDEDKAAGVAVAADGSARLYTQVTRTRGREIDLAIAACAIAHSASLWTLNREDFTDIPDLVLADEDKKKGDR